MFCADCGIRSDERERFCRRCGTDLKNRLLAPAGRSLEPTKSPVDLLTSRRQKDQDELTGNGIGSVIVGDGFFMVAIFLSITHSSISSLLWLLLLIPAFFFFGKGFSDVLQAKQIRRRLQQHELAAAASNAELEPPRTSVIDVFKRHTSGELQPTAGVTQRTTRQLE
jgi:uncharacterized membrane protein YvbJ